MAVVKRSHLLWVLNFPEAWPDPSQPITGQLDVGGVASGVAREALAAAIDGLSHKHLRVRITRVKWEFILRSLASTP